MTLAGKVAIVTGTSPNIGGGIADEGAKVICVDLVTDNAEDSRAPTCRRCRRDREVLALDSEPVTEESSWSTR